MENRIKKTRFFCSLRKELHWLEEMAQQGYFLADMRMGVIYTFEQRMPERIVYEIDRFDLPKSPTIKEIREKEQFVSLAQEMGWQEVTHTEDMTYYFCKPYEESGVNEMYEDEEMRRLHAAKFREYYRGMAQHLNYTTLVWAVLLLIFSMVAANWTAAWFCGFLCFCTIAVSAWTNSISEQYYREFSLSRQEWEGIYENGDTIKKVYRLFLLTHSLEKFLRRQSSQGWHLIKSGICVYHFVQGPAGEYFYNVDSRKAVNSRRKAQKQHVIADGKDINHQNNDWQVQSIQEAEKAGLDFVNAYGNNQIIYRSAAPHKLSGKSRLLHSWLGYWLIFAGGGFVIGYIIGMIL